MNTGVTMFNLILCILAVAMIVRAIFLSYLYGFKARVKSITWLLALDKTLYERLLRIMLWALLAKDLLAFSHMANRALLNFPPFPSDWVMISSTFHYLFMVVVAFISMVGYDDKLLVWTLNKLKTKKDAGAVA